MGKVISTLDNAITKLNSLYNNSSTPPSFGEEDYTVWTDFLNIGINLWEDEEGMLWKELFVKITDAPDGDKTSSATKYSYVVPSLFQFPASGYVWLGSNATKVPFKVIQQEDLQLYENDLGNWCYFLMDTTPTLEFNPNCTIPDGYTLHYNYYKYATALVATTDAFEMRDPMFAVYYALSELKKEEGDTSALSLATQKLEAMKTKNTMPTWWEAETFVPKTTSGFGTTGMGRIIR